MTNPKKTYCCIDLKSFYASVECVDRNKDPFEELLVVADETRGQSTICLAVSPALKALGVPGRCRMFQLPKNIEIYKARPRMKRYMEVSAQIVGIYLRYISEQDLHIYSIDECFIDLTPYVTLYKRTAEELVNMLRDEILKETGITATAGIGENLFLAKVALDITAKHSKNGIGILTINDFKKKIWHHKPITDIWQIGRGIKTRLKSMGISDLWGIAHTDIALLYKEFGINAEYLIDHAWGLEPCTIAEIKEYQPTTTSIHNGQVLPFDYTFEDGRIILREMVEEAVFELLVKHKVANSVHLYIGYRAMDGMQNHISISHKLESFTNSFNTLLGILDSIYCQRVDSSRTIKRINVSFGDLKTEVVPTHSLFENPKIEIEERALQNALVKIKRRFGNGAVMRGTSYRQNARGLERVNQVGGHHA